MARTISISIPHHLTQDEARRRIQARIAELRSQYGAKLASVQEQWTDNHMAFDITVMGQHLHGRIQIDPADVHVEIDLPWMLTMLSGRLQNEVQTEGRKLLE